MRHYSFELIKTIENSAHVEHSFDSEIIVKNIPKNLPSGVLDPREEELAKKTLAERTSRPLSLESIRANSGYQNDAINEKEILVKEHHLIYEGESFLVYENVVKENSDKKLPAIIYAHGGSFFTLSAKYAQNMCKTLAEIANCRVFNVEYGLAPEHPYPTGIRQFEETFLYVKSHAKELNVDVSKIIVMGDSSGGNFASQIAHKYHKEIALQILYYPAVYLDTTKLLPGWNINEYDIDPNYLAFIEPRLSLGRMDEKADLGLVKLIFKMYLQHGESPSLDELNSYNLNPIEFPNTLMFTSEYDGLRIQDDLFAKKLKDSGVEVRNIRYKGIHHAFIEKIGYFPQAEDSLIEISNAINNLK